MLLYFIYLFLYLFFNPHPRTYLLILESGGGRENVKDRNIDVREKHPLFDFCMCPAVDEAATLARALSRNWTSDPLGHSPVLNPRAPPARAKVNWFLFHLSFIHCQVLIKSQGTDSCDHFLIHSGSSTNHATSSPLILFLDFYLLILDREERRKGGRKGEREREKHRCVFQLTYAFTGCFLYVPWPGIEPATLAY